MVIGSAEGRVLARWFDVILAGAISASCADRPNATPVSATEDSGGGGLVFNPRAVLTNDCDASWRPGVSDAAIGKLTGADGPRCAPSRNVEFARDVEPLFARCSGEVCHTDTWGSGDPYPFLVGVKATECCDGRLRVAPYDPEGSYVVQKLTGRSLCRGSQMPLGVAFDGSEILTISDWICLGAPND
jgi:hypothetical protein